MSYDNDVEKQELLRMVLGYIIQNSAYLKHKANLLTTSELHELMIFLLAVNARLTDYIESARNLNAIRFR